MTDFHRMHTKWRQLLTEDPDAVFVGNSEEGQTGSVAVWMDADAIPFGYYKGKMIVELAGGSHDMIRVNKEKKSGVRAKLDNIRKTIAPTGSELIGDYDTEGITRGDMKFSGRIWHRKKLISFWEYPPRGELKKVIKDINDAIKNYDLDFAHNFLNKPVPASRLRIEVTPEWRIDIPNDVAMEDIKKNKMGYFDRRKGDFGDMDMDFRYSYLYKLKTVFAGKAELKGLGKVWQQMGISMDSGQGHLDSPVKKQLKKLDTRKQKKLWKYLVDQGRLSPAEIAMYRFMQTRMDMEKKTKMAKRDSEVKSLLKLIGVK